MGFWGTGAKMAIGTGLKTLRDDVLFPESKEMTDFQKKRLDFDVDLFKEEHKQLTDIDEGIVHFGDSQTYFKQGPFGRFFEYSEYPINIRTIAAENKQDQIGIMMDFLQVPDSLFDTWTDEKQQEILSYATSAGQEYEDIMNKDKQTGRRKDIQTSAEWDVIFPNLENHQWMRNALYQMSDNNADPSVKQIANEVPLNYLEKIYRSKHGDDAVLDRTSLPKVAIEHQNSIIDYYKFNHGYLRAGNEQSVAVRLSTKYEHFPEFWAARDILKEDYVTAKYGGQAFTEFPQVPDSRAKVVWGEVAPYAYKASITNPGDNSTRQFHRNSIEIYKSVYSTREIASKQLGLTDRERYKGGYTKELAFEDIGKDKKEIAKVAMSYQNFIIVHDLLKAEMEGDFAVSGKFMESTALGFAALSGAKQQIAGVINRLKVEFGDDNSLRASGLIGAIEKKANAIFTDGLTETDKAWLSSKGMTDEEIANITKEEFSQASEVNLSSAELRNKASRKTQLLASIARQKALTITLTYLAAATIQGEGGKAISDHDQKRVEAALSYGWWSTPEMRLQALGALHDSLSLYGEIAVAFNQATDAGDIYAINEYAKVSSTFDINRASEGKNTTVTEGIDFITDKALPITTREKTDEERPISTNFYRTDTDEPQFIPDTYLQSEVGLKWLNTNWDIIPPKNQKIIESWGYTKGMTTPIKTP